MVIGAALFYNFPPYAAATLIILELFEIVRFLLSWPYAVKWRNYVRLSLEFVILCFFITILLQTLYIE